MNLLHKFVLSLWILLVVSCTPVAPATSPTPTSVLSGTNTGTVSTEGSNELILATTTSTEDSGLLDFLLPQFEAQTGSVVKVVAVGTGEALTLGENGDADVLLVHARTREDEFIAAGFGVERHDVMYNDFVIVGPDSDPAGVRGSRDAVGAFQKIAAAAAPFISRGDESGTHTKELSLWDTAGIEPTGDWYQSVGQGMGAVLTMAEESQAYTLTDRGTYLARTAEGYALPILVEGDPRLFNPYGVILVNPERHPHVNAAIGRQFIEWLISPDTQALIGAFGADQFGQPLFVPNAASGTTE